jgi:hypothetical protein
MVPVFIQQIMISGVFHRCDGQIQSNKIKLKKNGIIPVEGNSERAAIFQDGKEREKPLGAVSVLLSIIFCKLKMKDSICKFFSVWQHVYS